MQGLNETERSSSPEAVHHRGLLSVLSRAFVLVSVSEQPNRKLGNVRSLPSCFWERHTEPRLAALNDMLSLLKDLDEVCSNSLRNLFDANRGRTSGAGADNYQQPDERRAGLVSVHAQHDGEHLFEPAGKRGWIFAGQQRANVVVERDLH